MKPLLVAVGLCLLFSLTGRPDSTTNRFRTPQEEALRWGQEYEQANKQLNEVYQKLLATQNAAGQKKLRAAQRAWVAFRDAEAEFVRHDWEGGSGQAAAVNSALAVLTRDRVREMKDRF